MKKWVFYLQDHRKIIVIVLSFFKSNKNAKPAIATLDIRMLICTY